MKITAPPEETPVNIEEVKAHMRVDFNDDDELIAIYLNAAVAKAEEYCRRAFVAQSWEMFLDAFPNAEIQIPRPPLLSVETVEYKLDGAAEFTEFEDYVVDTDKSRLVTDNDVYWPTDTLISAGGVHIEFTVGYGGAEDVPYPIKLAVMELTSHFYENREPIVIGTIVGTIPWAISALLSPYVWVAP